MLSRHLRKLFAGPRWKVRRAVYSSLLVVIVLFWGDTKWVEIFADQPETNQIRSFLYTIIVLFEGAGALNIRYGVMYGWAYKVEKACGAIGFTGLAAASATGLTGTLFQVVVWFVIIMVTKLTAFEWILSRNAVLDDDGLNTALGRIAPPRTREEVLATISTASSFVRHGYATEEDREELLDALGAPAIGGWAIRTRDVLIARRVRAAHLQAAGIDVEARDLDPHSPEKWPEVPR